MLFHLQTHLAGHKVWMHGPFDAPAGGGGGDKNDEEEGPCPPQDEEREEEGPGPPWNRLFLCLSFVFPLPFLG